jgi:hypothetical protein
MRRSLLWAAALGGAAYWASKQPGGIQGTWNRLQDGMRDIRHGEDPVEVGKRFLSGGHDEPEMSGEYHDEVVSAPQVPSGAAW